jgi:hypothetical protein
MVAPRCRSTQSSDLKSFTVLHHAPPKANAIKTFSRIRKLQRVANFSSKYFMLYNLLLNCIEKKFKTSA